MAKLKIDEQQIKAHDTANNKPSKYAGRPLSEEEYKEWQKAFTDIEDCIFGLSKTKKKASNKKK